VDFLLSLDVLPVTFNAVFILSRLSFLPAVITATQLLLLLLEKTGLSCRRQASRTVYKVNKSNTRLYRTILLHCLALLPFCSVTYHCKGRISREPKRCPPLNAANISPPILIACNRHSTVENALNALQRTKLHAFTHKKAAASVLCPCPWTTLGEY